MTETEQIIGIIPAAGRATRLGQMAGSKEVLRVGDGNNARPVGEFLLRQMAGAGAGNIFFVMRDGKWDIPATFGHGHRYGVNIAYLLMNAPWGPPFTIAQAFPFAGEATVVIGFPDILLWPSDAMARVVAHLHQSGADVTLGTFAARREDGCDLVTCDQAGQVLSITPKENNPRWQDNSQAWLFAAWRPVFTRFFAQRVAQLGTIAAGMPAEPTPEWPVGSILADGLAAGFRVEAVHFDHGQFLDVGVPQRLALAGAFPAIGQS